MFSNILDGLKNITYITIRFTVNDARKHITIVNALYDYLLFVLLIYICLSLFFSL